MPHPTPAPVRRAGPFDLIEPIPLPGSGAWWRAERVTYSRGANAVLVCVAADTHARERLRAAHQALLDMDDPRLPRVVGWYEGVGALAVTATTGAALSQAVLRRQQNDLAMTPATLLDIGVELSEVLVQLHDLGQPHGAVIPHHITLGSSGHVVLWGVGRTPRCARLVARAPTEAPAPWRRISGSSAQRSRHS